MTENDWLACDDPARMINACVANFHYLSDRKLRLFACACRHLTDLPWDGASAGWQYMEDHPEESVRAAFNPLAEVPAIDLARLFIGESALGYRLDAAQLAAIFREIVGNPFTSIALEPSWRTPTVLSLAQAAYEQRKRAWADDGTLDPVRLAILADAIEEAGCPVDSPNPLLAHLRGPGPHTRGCWATDAVLGKE